MRRLACSGKLERAWFVFSELVMEDHSLPVKHVGKSQYDAKAPLTPLLLNSGLQREADISIPRGSRSIQPVPDIHVFEIKNTKGYPASRMLEIRNQ
jgi:hypothetical protein